MSYQEYIDRRNQELMEDLLGRGLGDPDHYGIPSHQKQIAIKYFSRAYKVMVRVV